MFGVVDPKPVSCRHRFVSKNIKCLLETKNPLTKTKVLIKGDTLAVPP